jgi:hypothetical protein
MGLSEEKDRHIKIKQAEQEIVELLEQEIERRAEFKKQLTEKVNAVGTDHAGFSPDDPSL